MLLQTPSGWSILFKLSFKHTLQVKRALQGHSCSSVIEDTPLKHCCKTFFKDTFVGHSCVTRLGTTECAPFGDAPAVGQLCQNFRAFAERTFVANSILAPRNFQLV
jgi:hypothetical protein